VKQLAGGFLLSGAWYATPKGYTDTTPSKVIANFRGASILFPTFVLGGHMIYKVRNKCSVCGRQVEITIKRKPDKYTDYLLSKLLTTKDAVCNLCEKRSRWKAMEATKR